MSCFGYALIYAREQKSHSIVFYLRELGRVFEIFVSIYYNLSAKGVFIRIFDNQLYTWLCITTLLKLTNSSKFDDSLFTLSALMPGAVQCLCSTWGASVRISFTVPVSASEYHVVYTCSTSVRMCIPARYSCSRVQNIFVICILGLVFYCGQYELLYFQFWCCYHQNILYPKYHLNSFFRCL